MASPIPFAITEKGGAPLAMSEYNAFATGANHDVFIAVFRLPPLPPVSPFPLSPVCGRTHERCARGWASSGGTYSN